MFRLGSPKQAYYINEKQQQQQQQQHFQVGLKMNLTFINLKSVTFYNILKHHKHCYNE